MRYRRYHHRGLWFGITCALLLACLLMTGGCYRTYMCESGKSFEARDQMGGQRVIIDMGEGDLTLPKVPAASGSKYSDGRRTFWFQGDAVTPEVEGKNPYGRCVLSK
jgi:membrane-bound inhibitor of C-type lysozyme